MNNKTDLQIDLSEIFQKTEIDMNLVKDIYKDFVKNTKFFKKNKEIYPHIASKIYSQDNHIIIKFTADEELVIFYLIAEISFVTSVIFSMKQKNALNFESLKPLIFKDKLLYEIKLFLLDAFIKPSLNEIGRGNVYFLAILTA